MLWALRKGLNGFYSEEFARKLGSSVGPSLWVAGPGHTFAQLILPNQYFAQHPEYFALIAVKRSPAGQLCTTNPDVIDIIAGKMRRFFNDNPDRWCFSICPNDGYGWNECPRCRALDEKLGGARRWSVRGDQPVTTQRLGGRTSRNTDEMGPGDGQAGWASLRFVPEDPKAEHRLVLVVWGKSHNSTPIICSRGRGKAIADGSDWRPLELADGKLSGRPQWDSLVYRIRPDQFDPERRLQVIGLGGGDNQTGDN